MPEQPRGEPKLVEPTPEQLAFANAAADALLDDFIQEYQDDFSLAMNMAVLAVVFIVCKIEADTGMPRATILANALDNAMLTSFEGEFVGNA